MPRTLRLVFLMESQGKVRSEDVVRSLKAVPVTEGLYAVAVNLFSPSF
jgi:hypothetical protein